MEPFCCWRRSTDKPFFLACGAARISGRGEFVDPLPDLKGRQPAVLLVAPRVAVSTREVFQAFSRGARPIHAEAAQEVSERLAADMASGLRGVALLERAAELASSNDLLHATVAVVPTLVPFRRALARLLALPVGQSGSGPTCWTLYPSLTAARKAARVVEEALLAARRIKELAIRGAPDAAVSTTWRSAVRSRAALPKSARPRTRTITSPSR